ncbi:MAG: S-adenosylmethionine synthetase [Herbinix sp.]|jgi:S-adenosylmethionine synthetase|nr:S-adenosylmethionine synthetase [Herbinix sp.]
MININVNNQKLGDIAPYEFVERKGVGHPDTICDMIAERASMLYSQYWNENYGRIAHHWFDKVMLIGGESVIEFGYGKIVKPYKIIFAGKCAKSYNNKAIPLYSILKQACVEILSNVLTGFIAEEHITIIDELVDYSGAGRLNARYRPQRNEDLIKIGETDQVSNDCNLLSAYAPLSVMEQIVLFIEGYLNGNEFKNNYNDTGWDVKVVGVREGNAYSLLVNMPLLASKITSLNHYFQRKEMIVEAINKKLEEHFPIKVELNLNPQDDSGHIYLTVLGSAADTGDVGVVGRGNRINGLITPMRTMSIEAPNGKNPIDHTGKIYGVLAKKIAAELYEEYKTPVEVHIFTAKESKLQEPDVINVDFYCQTISEENKQTVKQKIQHMLSEVHQITNILIFDGVVMC